MQSHQVTIKPHLKHHEIFIKSPYNHHQVTSSNEKKSKFFMTKKRSSRMDRKVSAESSAPKTNWRSWRLKEGFLGAVEALKLGVKMGQRNSWDVTDAMGFHGVAMKVGVNGWFKVTRWHSMDSPISWWPFGDPLHWWPRETLKETQGDYLYGISMWNLLPGNGKSLHLWFWLSLAG